MNLNQSNQFNHEMIDVVIAGAGIVGSILALRLANAGLSVVVIEEQSINFNSHSKVDPRTLSITPASKIILSSLGVWQQIPLEKIGPYNKIHVWDETGDGQVEFDASETAETHLGYIVEQLVLEKYLNEQLLKQNNVNVHEATEINSINLEQAQVSISLNNGKTIVTKLLVGADGARSKVRDLASIVFESNSYEQTAVAGVIQTEQPHQKVARQRFLEDGILALLPLNDEHQCGFVWSTTDFNANHFKQVNEQNFCEIITEASESVLGEIIACYSRQTFPLSSAQASQYCDHRVVLVGDAAHRVHPLAGQGANLGIIDAEVLSNDIIQLHKQQRDFGLKAYLRRYERKRRAENIFMMNVFSGFKWLYGKQDFPIPLVRNYGMNVINQLTPIKQCIMQRAMGLVGDVPDSVKTPNYF